MAEWLAKKSSLWPLNGIILHQSGRAKAARHLPAGPTSQVEVIPALPLEA